MKNPTHSALNAVFSLVVTGALCLSTFAPFFAYAQEVQVSSENLVSINQDPVISSVSPVDISSPVITKDTPKLVDQTEVDSQASKKMTLSRPTAVESMSLIDSSGTALNAGDISQGKRVMPGVDQTSGSLTYTYNLKVPTGRLSSTPNLNLVYNSQQATVLSIWGSGWNDTIPYITRINKHGTDVLYSGSGYVFVSSLSGELVQITQTNPTINPEEGTYAALNDTGDFVVYAYTSGTWSARTKDGTAYSFGVSAASQQNDTSIPSNISKWFIVDQRDTNANYISYTYYKNAGQVYPDVITYSGNTSSSGIYEIDFMRSVRADVIDNRSTAFSVSSQYVISEIDIKVNGSITKKYNFSYINNTNGAQSLLSSVTETGIDIFGVATVLPATTFDYNQTTAHNWMVSSWSFPLDANGYAWPLLGGLPSHVAFNGSSTIPVFSVDINGDGLSDLIQSSRSGSVEVQNIYINNGNGWALNTSWSLPVDVSDSPYHVPLSGNGYLGQLSDVNGDGLPDIVQMYRNGTIEAEHVYLNTGSGWLLSSTWSIPLDASDSSFHVALQGNGYTSQLVDVNGDGLPDLVQAWRSGTVESSHIYLNTGTGWVLSTTFTLPFDIADSSYHVTLNGNGYLAQFADINGDGLPDLVESWHSPAGSFLVEVNNVYLNAGSGWVSSPWSFPLDANGLAGPLVGGAPSHVAFGGGNTVTVIAVDVNGDSLADLVQSWRSGSTEVYNIYKNTGTGWVLDPTWALPVDITNSSFFVTLNGNGYTGTPVDINGDGLLDIVQSWHSSTGTAVLESNYVYLNQGPLSVLSAINTPEGLVSSISYQPGVTAGVNNIVPQRSLVVKNITNTDSVTGLVNVESYTHTNGLYYFATPFDRQFAGFGMIQKTDSLGFVTKMYYHQGNTTDTTGGEYLDMKSKIGKPYRIEEYDASGNLYRLTVNKWDDYAIGATRHFVKLARTTVLVYDGTSAHTDTAVEYAYDNTNGTLLTKIECGQVNASTDGSFTDIGSDTRTTTYAYATGTTTGVVAPIRMTIVNNAGVTVQDEKYYYDTLPYGSVTKGNQTKVDRWISGTTYASEQKAYNTYGLVTSSTNPLGKVTSYVYDAYNLYPATVTDPLLHATSYLYNYANGQVTQKTDPNGAVFTQTYDGFGRPLVTQIPDPAGGAGTVIQSAIVYTDTPGAVSTQTTAYLNATTSVNTVVYFDGFGRKIQERTNAGTSGGYVVTDTIYNTLGLVGKQSLPYTSTGTARTSPTSTTALYTSYTYDALRRPVIITTAVGTTSYVYSGNKTSITDPRGIVKDYFVDAFGNLSAVWERNGAATYITTYTWDALGHLVGLVDALGNVRAFSYDGAGNRLTAQDLHAPADTTFGMWSYAYDLAGNMIQSTDPRAYVVNYAFDNDGRKISEDYTGATGTEIVYTYDTCTNGVDRLCRVTMLAAGGGNTTYAYDKNGNITSDIRVINSTTYTTTYAYDRQAHTTLVTYPDAAQVQYTYDTGGRLIAVDRKESGGTFVPVSSSMTYAPTGSLSSIKFGNGVSSNYAYDASHVYRLNQKITTNGAGTNLQKVQYAYDPNGNIVNINDTSATDTLKIVTYTYDDLNRLLTASTSVTASGTTAYSQNFGYNAIGNIVGKSDVGAYVYAGNTGTLYANPHAATAIAGVPLTYDKNGNTLTDGTRTNTWDYKSELVQVVRAGVTSKYFYDQDMQRTRTLIGSANTYTPNKYYSFDGTKKTKNIYAGDMLLAITETASGVTTPYYVHTDHLGSTGIVSDTAGARNQLLDYYPFGSIRLNQQATAFSAKRQYIGQQYDTDSGLNYLNARHYNSLQGRFMSEDSVHLSLGDVGRTQDMTSGQDLMSVLSDPQSLNSYAYARNNPIVKRDPDGKWTQGQIEGAQYLYDNSPIWHAAMNHPVAAGALVGIGSGAVAYGAAAGATALSVQYLGGLGTACAALCNQNSQQLVQQGIPNLHELPQVTTATEKMLDRGSKVGVNGINNFLNQAQQGTAYVDKTTGNINIFSKIADVSKYTRVTLNPEGTRIISAGLNTAKNVMNGIANSRFVAITK